MARPGKKILERASGHTRQEAQAEKSEKNRKDQSALSIRKGSNPLELGQSVSRRLAWLTCGSYEMTDAATSINLAIAAGSLIVSVVALVLSLRAQREANSAQRRIVEIEERREQEKRQDALQAKLLPELRETASNSYRLCLTNLGEAEARNVVAKLDGVPITAHHAAVQGDSLPSLVGPGSEVSCLLRISHDCAPPFKVEIEWDDDSGTHRVYRTTLTF